MPSLISDDAFCVGISEPVLDHDMKRQLPDDFTT